MTDQSDGKRGEEDIMRKINRQKYRVKSEGIRSQRKMGEIMKIEFGGNRWTTQMGKVERRRNRQSKQMEGDEIRTQNNKTKDILFERRRLMCSINNLYLIIKDVRMEFMSKYNWLMDQINVS